MIKKTNQTPKQGGYVKVKLNNKIHIKVNRPFPSFASLSGRAFARNHLFESGESDFRLQVHFHANLTHFHVKGFVRGLVLKQRHS